MTITGGCRCGSVHYSIEADLLHCWCRDCQYIGAGLRHGERVLSKR